MSDNHQSPFLRLPPEIRLEIYELLLLGPSRNLDTTHTTSSARILSSTNPDYHEYESLKTTPNPNQRSATNTRLPTLKIRIEDPAHYAARQPTAHLRTAFLIRSDRFRARCMATTYHLLSNPDLCVSILASNSQLHAECADVLYGAYTFDFDTHVEAVVPFLSDLTPASRARVSSLRLVKRALPYEKDFDRAEWAAACEYLAAELPGLRRLELGIVAGKPGPAGWEGVQRFSGMEFEFLCQMGGEGWEWVGDLLRIKGLVDVRVRPVVEHCPPPMSGAMASFVRFSASIDECFAGWLREKMVV